MVVLLKFGIPAIERHFDGRVIENQRRRLQDANLIGFPLRSHDR